MKDALVAPLISLSDPSPYSKQLNGSDERTPGFPNRSLASSTISAIVESNNMPCWMAAYTAPLCRWCSHRHNTIHWCSQRQNLYIDWCSCRHNNFISNTDVRHTTRASDRHRRIGVCRITLYIILHYVMKTKTNQVILPWHINRLYGYARDCHEFTWNLQLGFRISDGRKSYLALSDEVQQ